MAPRRRGLIALMLLLSVLLQVRGGGQLAAAARGADNDAAELGTTGTNNVVVVGDRYIGCLEMGFSRCFADPTLICVEDAMVECSLQAAAAPAAAATTAAPAAAPSAGGGAEAAELVLGTVGGIVARGITNLGAQYINCVEIHLAAKCFLDPTIGCVEAGIAAC